MTWLMAYALSDRMAKELAKFCKKNSDLVISQINWQIWFLKNNGKVLINLAILKNQDPDHFEFYAIEPLTTGSLPAEVIEILKRLGRNPDGELEGFEELKDIKLEYERKRS